MKHKYILNFTIGDGSLNIGDQIIRESIDNVLKELFNQTDVTIYNLSSHQPLSYVHRKFINQIKRLKEEVIFILSGANPLHLHYYPVSCLNQWALGILDLLYVKGVILIGVGTTESKTDLKSKFLSVYSKFFWRKILNKKFVHAVRDKESVLLLNRLGFSNVRNLGCPSLWKLTQVVVEKIPRNKADIVVTTLNSKYPSREDLVMIKILLKHYKEVYIWPQGYTDIHYIDSICSKVGRDSIKILHPNLIDFDIFLSSNEVDYIGLRVHAGIRALQHMKRTLIIAIDHRALSWSEEFGLPVLPRDNICNLEEKIISPSKVKLKIPEGEIIKYLREFRNYVFSF
ncbi:MAG: polysaccharide pyruvyl transferase family protein [Candidatus Anstonellales archaeon]